MRGRCTLIALVASCTLLPACSEDEASPTVLPSSAFPATGATGPATGSTGASGFTGVLPTSSPAEGTGNLSQGEATFIATGDVRANAVLPTLISSIYTPPPGGMSIVWTAGGTDASTLGIGGLSFVGSKPTAPTLILTFTTQTDAEISTFVSTAGECTITIGIATPDELAGTFTCTDLNGSEGQVVDVTGSFTAQG
jgi:hypothetical protein